MSRRPEESFQGRMLVSFRELGEIFLNVFQQAGIQDIQLNEAEASEVARQEFQKLVAGNRLEFNRTYAYVFWKSFGARLDLQVNGGLPIYKDLARRLAEAVKRESPDGVTVDALQKGRAKNVYDLNLEASAGTDCSAGSRRSLKNILQRIHTNGRLVSIDEDNAALLAMYKWQPEQPEPTLPELPLASHPRMTFRTSISAVQKATVCSA